MIGEYNPETAAVETKRGLPVAWPGRTRSVAQRDTGESIRALQLREGGSFILYSWEDRGPLAKKHLATHLTDELTRKGAWKSGTKGGRSLFLTETELGCPRLYFGGKMGPSISFSHLGRCTWGAVSGSGRVGIDAASPREFEGDYPFSRAFGRQELLNAMRFCSGTPSKAAALLWSLKEAVAKALECGFNPMGPLALVAAYVRPHAEGHLFEMRGKGTVPVWARFIDQGCLSIALIEP